MAFADAGVAGGCAVAFADAGAAAGVAGGCAFADAWGVLLGVSLKSGGRTGGAGISSSHLTDKPDGCAFLWRKMPALAESS